MSKLLWKSLLVSPAVLGATLILSTGAVRAADGVSVLTANSQPATEAAKLQTAEAQTPELQSSAKDATTSSLAIPNTLAPLTSTEAPAEPKVAGVEIPAQVAVTPSQLNPATPATDVSTPSAAMPATNGALAQATPADPANTDVLNQINRYSREGNSNSQDQVTNVSQLRDVSPGDWAFEALRSLD